MNSAQKTFSRLISSINNGRVQRCHKLLNLFSRRANPAFPFVFNIDNTLYMFVNACVIPDKYDLSNLARGLNAFNNCVFYFKSANDDENSYRINFSLAYHIKNNKVLYYRFKINKRGTDIYNTSCKNIPSEGLDVNRLKIVDIILSRVFNAVNKPKIYDI